jgi:acetyltransferase-like isoleucine patch superfamily enzyme
MKLHVSSYSAKIFALIRFVFLRLYFFRKIIFNKVSFIGKNFKIHIGKKASIFFSGKVHLSDNVELQCYGKMYFGARCAINSFSRIIAFEKIQLGDRVLIAQGVSILDHDHVFESKDRTLILSNKKSTKPIIIGNNVWLGDKVTVTKGVKIGDNVIIGANSVVTKDIPSNSLAAGNPANVIKNLN